VPKIPPPVHDDAPFLALTGPSADRLSRSFPVHLRQTARTRSSRTSVSRLLITAQIIPITSWSQPTTRSPGRSSLRQPMRTVASRQYGVSPAQLVAG